MTSEVTVMALPFPTILSVMIMMVSHGPGLKQN